MSQEECDSGDATKNRLDDDDVQILEALTACQTSLEIRVWISRSEPFVLSEPGAHDASCT